MSTDLHDLALKYLRAARYESGDMRVAERRLATIDSSALEEALEDDASRLAFWVNVYNGAALRQPAVGELWQDRLTRFRRRAVVVAGNALSLDAIEHGLLRRSRWKVGLGYVSNPRPSQFERRHRVEQVDPRIHFALNCGVVSCPPIAAYEAGRIGEQLEEASRSYLLGEVVRDGASVQVPALMLWYLGDFGGPPGIRRLLRAHGVAGWNGPIRFRPYDWAPAPDNWTAHDDELNDD
jgi:hypothetical protein